MTAPLVTVVVPTRDSGRTLEACLASVTTQTYPRVEVLVVDNGSTDATVSIARRYADAVETYGPERSAQRNRGAALGQGSVVMFVDSDMVLAPDVVAQSVAVLEGDPAVGSVIVDEVAFGAGWLVRSRVLEKELCAGDPSVEAARVFRRRAFDQVGGYDESLYACEDWDLADRVAAGGWRTGRVAAVIHHDEGRLTLTGAFTKKRYYGRNGATWLARNSGPRRGRPSALLRAVARSSAPRRVRAGLVLLKGAEWSGFAVGALARSGDGGRRLGGG